MDKRLVIIGATGTARSMEALGTASRRRAKMVSTEATGLAWALASVFLFGSFAVPIKTPAMQQARVHPIVIQCYKSTACFVTSFLVLLLRDFKFSYWGVLGAGIWVLNGIAAIAAVQCAGIGVSQAIWSAVTSKLHDDDPT